MNVARMYKGATVARLEEGERFEGTTGRGGKGGSDEVGDPNDSIRRAFSTAVNVAPDGPRREPIPGHSPALGSVGSVE